MLNKINYRNINQLIRNENIIIDFVLFCVSIIFILFFSVSGSPLYEANGGDCNIFRIIGIGITQGKLPYTDLFDHKGPLLFYLYALAHLISSGKAGLFFIQAIALFISLHYLYKLSRIYINVKQSFIAVFTILVFIATTMDEGGQAESFELPFLSIGLYYLILFYKNESCHKVKAFSFILGICFSFVLLLRMNDAFSQTGILFLFLLIYLLKIRKFHDIYISIVCFLFGVIVITIPFILYFLYIGIINDAWYGMFSFNFMYANLTWLHDYTLKLFIMSLFSICALLTFKFRTEFIYIIMPSTIMSIILIGNNPQSHYYLVLTPILCLIISILFEIKFIAILLWIFIVGGWNRGGERAPLWGSLIYKIHQNYKIYQENTLISQLHKNMESMLDVIPLDERNYIWNLNLQHNELIDIYANFGLTPMNRFFVPQHRIFDKSILEIENIHDALPQWVICNKQQIPKEESNKLRSKYLIISSYVYQGDSICLFKSLTTSNTKVKNQFR